MREELNIEIDVDLFLGEVSDPDLGICLRAHRCSWLAGTAEKTDHDAFDWCALDELMELDLLELDQRLLKQLAEFLPFET